MMLGMMGANAAAGGGATDPHWASVTALLRFDGTNGSTSITNEKAGGWAFTVGNQAQVSTAQAKFGTGSLLMDGANDYIQAGIGAGLGTTDWTFDTWFRVDSLAPAFQVLTDIDGRWFCIRNNALVLYAADAIVIQSAAISAATWYHASLVKSAGVWHMFLDGALVGTYTDAVSLSNGTFYIGASSASSWSVGGYVDDARFTAGVARYTASFPPPTAAYPNS